ncbi:uncharacterized protein TRIADDRAFT_60207 [Trichoplax adhaerens]|uniref:MYND-type domain-containing protein n=1 Tax=Trichoplax adhaerens TaxID=10228 RepID=B3S7L3_TRIAD|nr:hypothetical protein TRIADDRAFT_60207 [Trichoplax adhaerens]EDV21310.1 hypothetical protein TRIADDRAFT_60207 [Trichoplax adhaerens]|eukprot:XP_002116277.1 hypothetical protein TRIADDRAFT_60207 [Trichoplax adhaerens]
MLLLLLKRGANPNTSSVPYPPIFFSVKAADVNSVKMLLQCSANTSVKMATELGGLTPLHIAVALPGEDGINISEMLLQAGAPTNTRASCMNGVKLANAYIQLSKLKDDIKMADISHHNQPSHDQEGSHHVVRHRQSLNHLNFTHRHLTETITNLTTACNGGLTKDGSSLCCKACDNNFREGGRTALHITCSRQDNFEKANQIVQMLISNRADCHLLCNGHSPLSLAIIHGNDLAVDTLLKNNVDPNQPLGFGVGSALAAASTLEAERFRTLDDRIRLINKLIKAGADILQPIVVTKKLPPGTAVDYAFHAFHQDKKIAHTPYHALTPNERECYNARRRILAHYSDALRERVTKDKNAAEAWRPETTQTVGSLGIKTSTVGGEGEIAENTKNSSRGSRRLTPGRHRFVAKPSFCYCYECGRSIGVRLTACSRCLKVYYCSKQCKLRAWNARHKDECYKIDSATGRPIQSAASKQPSEGPSKEKKKGTALLKLQKKPDGKRSSTKGSSIRVGQDSKLSTSIGRKPTSAANSKVSISKSTSSSIKK